MDEEQATPAIARGNEPTMEPVEPRNERIRQHNKRGRLYALAFSVVVLIVVVVAFVVDNAHQVKLGWIFGSSQLLLVWIIIVSVVLGWVLGLSTAFVFRLRTRRRHPDKKS